MNVGPGLPSRQQQLQHNPLLVPAYSLIVAGPSNVGKSALLRLLLDTAPVSPHASQAQLDSKSRFLRALHLQSQEPLFSECELEVLWAGERVLLRLIDSPPLDFATGSDDDLERGLRDILHLVESRYIDGARDEATVGESHVHLCLYVLDPATIVPRTPNPYPYRRPSPPSPPASSSPPSALPPVEIAAIRRLSSRVNVLPVLGRCDAVPLTRLADLKRAVRRDLADAGLGFGIFDNDATAPSAAPDDVPLPLLPYALFAPESFPPVPPVSPDDDDDDLAALQGRFIRRFRWGVLDALDTRHSDFLALRRATMLHHKVLKKYTKDYLYEKFKVDSLLAAQQHRHGRVHPGSVHALLNHREERDGLVEHDYARPASTGSRLSPLHHHPARLPAVTVSAYDRDDDDRDRMHPRERERERDELREVAVPAAAAPAEDAAPGRKRKITMACNFCRSRKLKCDGVRPACAQCVKRNNTCDYQPHTPGHSHAWKYKRAHAAQSPHPSHWANSANSANHANANGNGHIDDAAAVRGGVSVAHHEDVDELDEEASSASEYGAAAAAAAAAGAAGGGGGASASAGAGLAPPASANAAQRKRVSVDMLIAETLDHPSHAHAPAAANAGAPAGAASTPSTASTAATTTTSTNATSAPWYEQGTGMGVLDVGSEGDKKKRLNRQSANYGSKAVACVHCRARKTRCDAARPACGNCARRALTCSYVHTQPSQPRSKGKRAALTTNSAGSAAQSTKQSHSPSPGPGPGQLQQQQATTFHTHAHAHPHGHALGSHAHNSMHTHAHAQAQSHAHAHPHPHPHAHVHPHAHAQHAAYPGSGATASPPPPPQGQHQRGTSWSPVPVDSALEESAERDRPRSPVAPPIATLSSHGHVHMNGSGKGEGEREREREGSVGGKRGRSGSVEEDGREKRMKWEEGGGEGEMGQGVQAQAQAQAVRV